MIILIADDDRNIRFALKSMLLDILNEEETTIFEAQDGLELVSICNSTLIDIAFVDIKMPNLNGLDAIERVKEFNKDISFIILSGYNDFKYAKKGITLGITDYLLKPVDSDDLRELIEVVAKEKRANKNYQKSTLQAQVFNIVSYLPLLGDKFDFLETPLPPSYIYLVVDFIFFFPLNFDSSLSEFKYTTLANFPQLLSKILPLDIISSHLQSSDNNVQCIIRIDMRREKYVIKEIENNILHLDSFPQIKVVALYSKCSSLVDAVKSGVENIKYEYLSLNQKNYRCLEYVKEDTKESRYLSLLWDINETFINGDTVSYRESVAVFEKEFDEIPSRIKLKYVLNSLSALCGANKIKSHNDFVKLLKEHKILNRENTHNISEYVKKYVEANYMKNFGINQIADELELTPNYLSSLFHKITGIYFSDYLNTYRLEISKTMLLSNSSASIKDIAMMVGYSNARYFSTLFKQSYKMLPTTYRKEHLK